MKLINREMILLEEPYLEFGYSQKSKYTKDGLVLFGPPTDEGQPLVIRYGLVGTSHSIKLFKNWLIKVRGIIPSANPDKAHFHYWPGFSTIFNANWSTTPVAEYTLDEKILNNTILIEDRHQAVYETVSLFENAISKHCKEEERQPDLWFVLIPENIYLYGRPKSFVPTSLRTSSSPTLGRKIARKILEQGTLFNDLADEARTYQFDLDFHAQLKARLLGKAVLQIVRESTLHDSENTQSGHTNRRQMQDPATTAWNLSTAVYYKSQGIPWRLAQVRKGVCYIGLVYKRDETLPKHENVCCGAQMFLDSGDGVVFRGAMGPWTSKDNRQYHLSAEAAENLINTVLQSYIDKHDSLPSEIFIHGRTNFNDEEWMGFNKAIQGRVKLIGVKILKSNRLKVFRSGKKPLVRGTAWILNERKAYLWSNGYIPRLATYPGWEVPNPLEVEIQRGNARIETVLKDVLGLTKLNYNACLYGDSKPVTLRFADDVGNILTATPDHNHPPLPFKYYI